MVSDNQFKKFVDRLGIGIAVAAQVFGVDYQTAYSWYAGRNGMRTEFRFTLHRLASEPNPALSPHLPSRVVEEFRDGKWRARNGCTNREDLWER